MDWQQLIVGVIVLAAMMYLARQTWRTWFGAKAGCSGGCGCAAKKSQMTANAAGPTTTMISVNELTQRIRSQS